MSFGTKQLTEMYKNYLKRLFDICASILILLGTSPIFLITSLILLFQNEGKVFFYQKRPGKNQIPFNIIKFRTMNDKRDIKGILLPDNKRITTCGKWIRKLSIDELPQMINVLKGEMSLIGPRPLLFKYIPHYTLEQNRRHEVRPGVTGWAQINGRNAISWKKKFELDIEYIDNISFIFDMKIFFLTILKIVKMDGINQTKARPMHPFNGSN